MINRHTLNKQIKKMSRMFKMIGIQNVFKRLTNREVETRSTFISYTSKSSCSLDEGLSGLFDSKLTRFGLRLVNTFRMQKERGFSIC